ncbi:MAG: glycosyltransferase family 39 protein [Anaerolineales bacterium]|nr:glycosyltransferase family 39 protein [Anaerolineales bacterium]
MTVYSDGSKGNRLGLPQAVLYWAAILVVLLGAGLRMYNLGGDSFWYDELLTVLIGRGPLEATFTVRSHPPLVYLLIKACINLLGENEIAARMPSAIAGIVALPLIMVWARSLGHSRAGFWAGLFLALSPFHVKYSQEARHYSMLATHSMLTLFVLSKALKTKKVKWWLVYALSTVLNLYIHYGAFLVLASQMIVIAWWMFKQAKVQSRRVLYPIFSALVVIVLFSPRIPHLIGAFSHNVGAGAARGSTDLAAVQVWIGQAYNAFGSYSDLLAPVMAGLALVGMLLLAGSRDWTSLYTIVAGLVTPILLINIFHVARWAFPKYIIYLLPLYLMSAGIAIDAGLEWFVSIFSRPTRRGIVAVPAITALVLILVNVPLLQKELQSQRRAWRDVAEDISKLSKEGDIIISLAIDLASGFNQGSLVLPYYLEKENLDIEFLASNSIEVEKIQDLVGLDANVWGVVLDRVTSMEFLAGDAQVVEYDGDVFLIRLLAPRRTAPERLEQLYEAILPAAITPSPLCLLQRDLAAIKTAAGDFAAAEQVFLQASELCPDEFSNSTTSSVLHTEILHGLLEQAAVSGDKTKTRQIAAELLRKDAKDPVALDAITIVGILQAFRNGQVLVMDKEAPEPVQEKRFVMPYDGDWGDVLLIHPPASVSYRVDLPEEPTIFHTRLAMAPESWDWGGDGSTFIVTVAPDGSAPIELYRKHISNDSDDQRWHNVEISLAEFAGKMITLTLSTEAGEMQDMTGDWAGWETPRIVLQSVEIP